MTGRRTWTVLVALAVVLGTAVIDASPAAAVENFVAVQSGPWNDPATWGGGVVPSGGWFTTVTIPANIAVTIPPGESVQGSPHVSGFLFVGGRLSAGDLFVEPHGYLSVQDGVLELTGELENDGTLVNNGVLLTGERTTNAAGAVFRNADELSVRAAEYLVDGFFNHGRFENLGHAVLTTRQTGGPVPVPRFHNAVDGTVVNETGAVFDVGGTLTNRGTLLNESAALVTTVAPYGHLANGSVLDNYGAVDNLATIDNTGGDFRLRCDSTLTGNPVGGDAPRNWCDSDAPILETSPPAPTEATSAAGAVVTYHVIAKDDHDPAPAISCVPPSGATFAMGTTTVSCTATDYVGNSASTSFAVVVQDTTAPTITVTGEPAVVVVQHNAYVDAGATASDIVSGDLTAQIVTTNPVDVEVPGVYTVRYEVSDAAGNVATASRTVEVITAARATDTLVTDVASLDPSPTKTELTRFVTQASQILHDSRPSNDSSAGPLLDSFTLAVIRAERKGSLSAAVASDLNAQAVAIKSSLAG